MKRIGMLGGMSWESTLLYYRLANQAVGDRLGGLHSADLLVRSLDFSQVYELQIHGRWEEAAELMLEEALALEGAGADLILICSNYMHKIAPELERGLRGPLLHIADVAARAAMAVGARRVGLVGTAGTMTEPFYASRLGSHGLDVLVPDTADRQRLDHAIFGELCQGVTSDETRAAVRAVLTRLVAKGAEAIVLGCTELELLLTPDDSTVPLLQTARLHILEAVDASLS